MDSELSEDDIDKELESMDLISNTTQKYNISQEVIDSIFGIDDETEEE